MSKDDLWDLLYFIVIFLDMCLLWFYVMVIVIIYWGVIFLFCILNLCIVLVYY